MLARVGSMAVLGFLVGLAAWTACTDYDDREPPPDAAVETRTSAPSDASSGCKDPCDCDGDGFENAKCVDASDDASAALVDCADDDPLRHPQAEFSARKPALGQTPDWNCDGTVEKRTEVIGFCTSSPLGGCIASPPLTDTFGEDHACGETAPLVTCQKDGNGCKVAPTGANAVQQCR